MPRKRRQFINNEIYHATIKRIGDELLFKNVNDYFRGIFSIYEFNNSNLVEIQKRRRARAYWKRQHGGGPTPFVLEEPDKRSKLVEILCFCLMPNHIHLLLYQIQDNGISKFIQKIGSGYPAYFRGRYGLEKRGHFFQDKFNSVHIKTDIQLRTVFAYIHANPVSIIEPGWKEHGIKNLDRVIRFLEEKYRWSSYWDYIGKKNFPSVTERDFFLKVIGSEQECRGVVQNWLKYKAGLAAEKGIIEFPNLALE